MTHARTTCIARLHTGGGGGGGGGGEGEGEGEGGGGEEDIGEQAQVESGAMEGFDNKEADQEFNQEFVALPVACLYIYVCVCVCVCMYVSQCLSRGLIKD